MKTKEIVMTVCFLGFSIVATAQENSETERKVPARKATESSHEAPPPALQPSTTESLPTGRVNETRASEEAPAPSESPQVKAWKASESLNHQEALRKNEVHELPARSRNRTVD